MTLHLEALKLMSQGFSNFYKLSKKVKVGKSLFGGSLSHLAYHEQGTWLCHLQIA